jgi:hypothetical protein
MHRTPEGATLEVESPPAPRPAAEQPHVVALAPAEGLRSERDVNRWLLVLMLVLCGAFAGSFARFILYPAIGTVASAPADRWNSDGP